jgi:phosphotriesterase-related protein
MKRGCKKLAFRMIYAGETLGRSIMSNGTTSNNATKRITTVLGDIQPQDLGFTTMHEHLNCDMRLMSELPYMQEYREMIPPEMLTLKIENLATLRQGVAIYSDDCRTTGDIDFTVGELAAFAAIGGGAVVDASPVGLRGDVRDLVTASERSGVHIVCATGIYFAAARPPEFIDASDDYQYEYFKREVEEGINETSVRPGFVKCAINTLEANGKIARAELASIRACARVARETGLSLHIHTGLPATMEHTLVAAQLVLEECGLEPSRLLMLHTDQYIRDPQDIGDYVSNISRSRNIYLDDHIKLMEKGVNIGFDSCNSPVLHLPDDNDRIKALLHLTNAGYAKQIVLGHDIFHKASGVQWGGSGFCGFFNSIIQQLLQYGMDPDAMTAMCTDNPARILAR